MILIIKTANTRSVSCYKISPNIVEVKANRAPELSANKYSVLMLNRDLKSSSSNTLSLMQQRNVAESSGCGYANSCNFITCCIIVYI